MKIGRSDRGTATVVVAVGCVALLLVTSLLLQWGAATVARHRAENAADLASLAAAAQVPAGTGAACSAASDVAGANGGDIARCSTDGSDAVVVVRVRVRIGPIAATATGRARAGPAGQGRLSRTRLDPEPAVPGGWARSSAMDTERIVVQAHEPDATIGYTRGTPILRAAFIFTGVVLFVAAVVFNLIVEQGPEMWAMTLFGAAVISTLLSAAAVHAFARD